MITATNVLVLLAMVVGTVGIVVPVLPGLVVVWGAVLVWALARQDGPGWLALGFATLVYAVGLVAKYLLPGRRMKTAGVDAVIVAVALVVAVVGFFVIPVVGGPVGFVVAIYVLELAKRREHAGAWQATVQAIRAVGLNIGIELATAFAIIATWGVAVYLTR
ncbi:DUF456 domain-containing protein [Terrabacter carboxydivorans]|uniref:DUF456 domain-containing protein n=1 Tax=Terrabacter carboxydivorans TaxID=619730 RepID=A0ABP5Z3H0_9MICO